MAQLAARYEFSKLSVLHIAPEECLATRFRTAFGSYTSADLERRDVDLQLDLRDTGLADESYDVVYASDVLEHIADDRAAIAEIRRILRPDGFAVLAVPIVCETTIEYPRPAEYGHMRAPGPDYIERYAGFARVDVFRSASMAEHHQTWTYEDRSRWPTPNAPFRTPSPGKRHESIVAVCYKSASSET